LKEAGDGSKAIKPEMDAHEDYFTGLKKAAPLEFKVSGKKQPKDVLKFFDNNLTTKEFQRGEMPSANMHSSAKALARLGAYMANKGSFEGK